MEMLTALAEVGGRTLSETLRLGLRCLRQQPALVSGGRALTPRLDTRPPHSWSRNTAEPSAWSQPNSRAHRWRGEPILSISALARRSGSPGPPPGRTRPQRGRRRACGSAAVPAPPQDCLQGRCELGGVERRRHRLIVPAADTGSRPNHENRPSARTSCRPCARTGVCRAADRSFCRRR